MTTLVLSILNGSSSFLHTIRTNIKAWMSLNFSKIPLLGFELAAPGFQVGPTFPTFPYIFDLLLLFPTFS